MDFTILAVVLLIGVGVPIRNKLIRKYRDKKQDEMKNMDLMTNSLDDLSFIKRKEIFSYQNEYRYLIVDELEERKNIRFEIGDLKDLATIMSKSEFLKTL